MLVLLVLFLPTICLSYHHFQQFQHDQRNIQCQCVPLLLCPDEGIATNGHGLLDPRIGNRKCPVPNEVCCESPVTESEEATAESTVRCGTRDRIKSRITSGTIASFGELPWNLIIQESGEDKANLYKCGGSLIHPKVAITAAHCVSPYIEEPEKILVRAGEWDIDRRDEPLPSQDSFVEEILVHMDYDVLSLRNDIAILILSESFRLGGNIGMICLSSSREKVVENKCVVSGWGKNSHSKGRYSSVLRKVQLPMMSRSLCLETLRTTRLGPRYNLHKSFICAGGRKDQDSCKGDGGGPLICPLFDEDERYVQIGIVSWGIGCGVEGIPGVYVNVPLFLDWIAKEMNDRNLDTSSFTL